MVQSDKHSGELEFLPANSPFGKWQRRSAMLWASIQRALCYRNQQRQQPTSLLLDSLDILPESERLGHLPGWRRPDSIVQRRNFGLGLRSPVSAPSARCQNNRFLFLTSSPQNLLALILI